VLWAERIMRKMDQSFLPVTAQDVSILLIIQAIKHYVPYVT